MDEVDAWEDVGFLLFTFLLLLPCPRFWWSGGLCFQFVRLWLTGDRWRKEVIWKWRPGIHRHSPRPFQPLGKELSPFNLIVTFLLIKPTEEGGDDLIDMSRVIGAPRSYTVKWNFFLLDVQSTHSSPNSTLLLLLLLLTLWTDPLQPTGVALLPDLVQRMDPLPPPEVHLQDRFPWTHLQLEVQLLQH